MEKISNTITYRVSIICTVSKKIRATTNSNQHSVVTEIWLLVLSIYENVFYNYYIFLRYKGGTDYI